MNRHSEQLWKRLRQALANYDLVPAGDVTPTEVAEYFLEQTGDDRVKRFVGLYYVPAQEGAESVAMSASEAERLVLAIERACENKAGSVRATSMPETRRSKTGTNVDSDDPLAWSRQSLPSEPQSGEILPRERRGELGKQTDEDEETPLPPAQARKQGAVEVAVRFVAAIGVGLMAGTSFLVTLVVSGMATAEFLTPSDDGIVFAALGLFNIVYAITISAALILVTIKSNPGPSRLSGSWIRGFASVWAAVFIASAVVVAFTAIVVVIEQDSEPDTASEIGFRELVCWDFWVLDIVASDPKIGASVVESGQLVFDGSGNVDRNYVLTNEDGEKTTSRAKLRWELIGWDKSGKAKWAQISLSGTDPDGIALTYEVQMEFSNQGNTMQFRDWETDRIQIYNRSKRPVGPDSPSQKK